jgi:hypothetical protein
MDLLLVGTREAALFCNRGSELGFQPGDAITRLMFSGQERQLALFGPSFELGGFLPVLNLPALLIRDLPVEGGGQAQPFCPERLDLRGKLLPLRERVLELRARLLLSSFERRGFLPVLSLPLLVLRDLRVEGCGETPPFGLESFDLRCELLPVRERLFELLERSRLSRLELGGFLPILSFPMLPFRDLRIEGCGQTLPFGLEYLDLNGELLALRERVFELFARSCLSHLELGDLIPILDLPVLALLDLRIKRRGQTLPFGPESLDLGCELLSLRDRLFELLERSGLSHLELGGSLSILSFPFFALRDLSVEGCRQPLPFGL